MSHDTRSRPHRRLLSIGFIVIGLATSAATAQTQSSSPNDSTIAYFAEFTGVGAEERDMIWRGAVAGTAVGELTIRLAHAGRDMDTAKPTWPVEGIIFVSGEDPQRAFIAEVNGTIDWPSRRATLAGGISVGYMRGARIELKADLVNYDLSGELRVVPVSLAASGSCR